jgi:Flp pilus assembly protein TadD
MNSMSMQRSLVRFAAGAVLAVALNGCANQPVEHQDDNPMLQAFRHEMAEGELAQSQQRHAAAAAAYLRAHALDPANYVICTRGAEQLLAAGDTKGALANYERALSVNPDFAPALEGAGILLVRWKRYGDAQPMLERTVALLPDSWKAHSALGIAADAHRQFGLAAAHHQRAIDLKPQDSDLHSNLGFSLLLADKLDAAAESLWTALEIDGKNQRAWRNLARVRVKQGNLAGALRALREIEGPPAAFNDLGYLALQNGEIATARKFFNLAIDAAPGGYPLASDNLQALDNRH